MGAKPSVKLWNDFQAPAVVQIGSGEMNIRFEIDGEMALPSGLETGKQYQVVVAKEGVEKPVADFKIALRDVTKTEGIRLPLSKINLQGLKEYSGTGEKKGVEQQKGDAGSCEVKIKTDTVGPNSQVTTVTTARSTITKSDRLGSELQSPQGLATLPGSECDGEAEGVIESKIESIASGASAEESTRLPAVNPHENMAELEKTDKKKHSQMKSRIAEDIKEIAAAIGKASVSNLARKKKKRDLRRENKWIEMKKYLEKNHRWPSQRQLKERIRKGIPQSLRGYTWLRLLGADRKIASHKGLYSKLSCIGKPEGNPEPFRTIDKDVPRTFPENHFLHGEKDSKSSAAERLREVLYAYVHYDKQVQYCQGMNLVAAFLMISCPFQNEEVFWMLERLCHHPDYALQNLYGPQLELAFEFEYVLKKLLKSYLPKLSKALTKADEKCPMLPFGSINVFAPKWVISLWSIVPANCAVRIWDIFFNEGHKMLYRVALYVLKHCQKDLLAKADDKSLDGGDYLEALSRLQKASYINSLEIWKDEDVCIQGIFKLTSGLKNSKISAYKKKFWKAKKKKQLELEMGQNRRKHQK